MKERKILFTLLSVVAIVFLSLGAAIQAQAQQTFSGRAVGIDAETRVTTSLGTSVTAEATIADTGPLPPEGGTRSSGALAGTVNITTLGLTTTFTTGVIQTMTSGGTVNGVPTSQSQATVNDLNLAIAGNTITADTLTANSQCTCGANGPTCSGDTVVEDLVITLADGSTVTLNGSVAPNRTFSAIVTATVGSVTTTTTTTVIVNEQIRTADSITVNALHVIVTETVTDSITGVTTTTTTDIIVAQAHSDIQCLGPTAAPVSVSGRVITPIGRGVARARVLLTNSTGETRMVMTNPFGYFRFKEIDSGETYVFEVTHKRYTFTPQVLSVTNDLTELNFTALP
jgi:hypothetical protein